MQTKLDTSTYNSDKAGFETTEHATATYQPKGDYALKSEIPTDYATTDDIQEAIQDANIEVAQPQSADEKLMQKVLKAINKNLNNPDLNAEMIAAEVGISRVHLYRKLKELTNQSTRDFIRNIRLKQAEILLKSEKNYNMSEIAQLVGFNNTTYFSNAFKELYGVSPSKYMERCKEKENEEKEEA